MFEYVVVTYGYPALFVGAFLEGEVVLIIAGFMARIGYLNLPWVLAVALLATIAADQFYFYMGRHHGKYYLEKHPKWQPKVERVHDILHRHQNLIMLGFRFMYQFRVVTPFVMGTSEIPWSKFLAYNAFGAIVWTALFGVGGYYFGNALGLFLSDLRHYERTIVLGLIAVAAAIWIFNRYRGHRRRG